MNKRQFGVGHYYIIMSTCYKVYIILSQLATRLVGTVGCVGGPQNGISTICNVLYGSSVVLLYKGNGICVSTVLLVLNCQWYLTDPQLIFRGHAQRMNFLGPLYR